MLIEDSDNIVCINLKMCDLVKENDYIIVQRQNYKKYHKLTPKNIECRLGKDLVDLSAVIGQPYWTTYKMDPKPKAKNSYLLSKCDATSGFKDEILSNTSSGADNRDILDDGSSQKLSTEEIVNLKESGLSAQCIVGTLIKNSKTFASKTEYSQEKYLKKKEKKYCEYILIRRPTIRLLSEIIIGKLPNKALGLRMDTLAQLTTIAGAKSGGSYIVFETGCQGLVSAAFLNAIGSQGTIIHVHVGTHPEKQAINALNLEQERLDQVLSVNIANLIEAKQVPAKEINQVDEVTNEVHAVTKEEVNEVANEEFNVSGKRKGEKIDIGEWKKARWEENQEKAMALLKETAADGLVIVGKEHPGNILRLLLRYLHSSRSFVVFCSVREPLQDLFMELKMRSDITAVRLTESWLRGYQVLPDRTHPDIVMNASGGYLLSGIKVTS